MKRFRLSKRWMLALGSLVLLAAFVWLWYSPLNGLPHLISSLMQSTHSEQFPAVDMSTLSPRQQKIVALLKQEYALQDAGLKYSEGTREPWCADFVSWIMKEAGGPLTNPHSGSWRIPGTYTLREYYQSAGAFKPADSGYQPTVGDVMLYDNPSPFGQHTNIVVKNDNGTVTTVGGNEMGRIRVYTHTPADKVGFVGYGILNK